MQLTVNQIEAANVQQVSAPKAGAIKQAFDSLLKETFTPVWKKWKRKYYAMLIVDCSLRKGVEMNFPLLLVETEEEKEKRIEEFLEKEFKQWQIQEKRSLRTRELLGQELTEDQLKYARIQAEDTWWLYLDRKNVSQNMSRGEMFTLAQQKVAENSKRVETKAVTLQEHAEQVVTPQSYEENLFDAMKILIDGIESSLAEQVEVIEVTPVAEITQTEVIEVAVETQPTDEGVAKATKQAKKTPTKTTANKKPKNKTQIVQLTIKELKAYAKEREIDIPGGVTDIREQRKIVIKAQNGVTKILPVKS